MCSELMSNMADKQAKMSHHDWLNVCNSHNLFVNIKMFLIMFTEPGIM